MLCLFCNWCYATHTYLIEAGGPHSLGVVTGCYVVRVGDYVSGCVVVTGCYVVRVSGCGVMW